MYGGAVLYLQRVTYYTRRSHLSLRKIQVSYRFPRLSPENWEKVYYSGAHSFVNVEQFVLLKAQKQGLKGVDGVGVYSYPLRVAYF